jgi:hypothetical protein
MLGLLDHFSHLRTPTEPHKKIKKTTKACHKGIKKLQFLGDFGVFSAYYRLDFKLAVINRAFWPLNSARAMKVILIKVE